ncbi:MULTISPECIES: TIGR03667 family PPOX class F420-dependent oxidoreductase [Kribbella]|uniref:TIGR03667 family PPOX class F420-dependent oxidoreductase n=2 Tax=Kribbella TaxID=182639 RepID=A0A4R0IL85_9ACTN|nr:MULTISPECIES: TIGR03667 family PPOX class F420-dependent oxidoreductase [Kribbella]TCC25196.1 TIGR03667 family PPOX class F420-dependent oxidoreductase [Kribbella speibonae]TCC26077.1 TIGR03667 family PPOX class F420-dependent oxidoreductase [Kribbella sindirgiensis]TCC33014.1 TIGR03667 family PPOX class F420-dependent oxidoreductase [Kribbella speibonae]
MFTIDTSTGFGKRIERQLDDELVVWLTTVGRSGTPAPNPVWFLWHDNEILISSQPNKAKLHNVADHPQVTVNFNATHTGGDVGVISGTAVVDTDPISGDALAAYNAKYGDDIAGLGMTPDQFHADYSVLIRITPGKLRGF